jgi:hypothetical protein
MKNHIRQSESIYISFDLTGGNTFNHHGKHQGVLPDLQILIDGVPTGIIMVTKESTQNAGVLSEITCQGC